MNTPYDAKENVGLKENEVEKLLYNINNESVREYKERFFRG